MNSTGSKTVSRSEFKSILNEGLSLFNLKLFECRKNKCENKHISLLLNCQLQVDSISL